MLFEEIIKKRQAVRNYLDREVSEGLIEKILNLASLSPSAGNLQARRVIVVKDKTIIKELRATCGGFGRFSIEPPVVFVICSVPEESAVKYGDRGKNLYALQDATIFASYLQLAAVSLGMVSCWIGNFDEKKALEILSIPKDLKPVAMIPIGYSREELREKSRKTLSELIYKEI